MTQPSSNATKVTTPEAIISYPNLFTPRIAPGASEAKYSCTLIFPEKTDLTPLVTAVRAAVVEKFGPDRAAELLSGKKLRLPFRNDWEEKGYPENSIFLNCTSKQKPGVVSRFAGPDGKPTLITDPAEVYPGARVRASLRAFYYDNSGNKGVSFGLNHIQKLGDGERLDGRLRVEDAFEALDDLGDAGSPFGVEDDLNALLGR